MISEKSSKKPHPSIFTIWGNTCKTIIDNPKIIIPFVIIVVIELAALTLLYYFPREPVSSVLEPIIIKYWGARYLHYPINFFLIPKLLYWVQVIVSIVLGSLAIGIGVSLFGLVRSKKHVKLFSGIRAALGRYPSLFLAQFFLYLLYIGIYRFIDRSVINYFAKGNNKLLMFSFKAWQGPISITISTALGIIIQMFFVYIFAYIIIENKRLSTSIIKGFGFCKDLFFRTFILVLAPTLLYLPIVILNFNLSFVINKISPEFCLVIFATGVVLGSLIVDPWIVLSCTEEFLSHKRQ